MHFLFPSDPFNKRAVDPDYADDLTALTQAGFSHSLFSFEDFLDGKFRAIPALPTDQPVMYRGWMLTPTSYQTLNDALVTSGAALLTSPTEYKHAHHLPEWYDDLKDFTPATIVVPRNADFVAEVASLPWKRYFVKDFVKSLSNERGSIADTPDEIGSIVDLMEQYRGFIEGGVCIREVEDLHPHTEQRYFAFKGKVYGAYGQVPPLVQAISDRVSSPFFSIDMIADIHGRPRLIEVGDGQVSSRKHWDATVFANIFKD